MPGDESRIIIPGHVPKGETDEDMVRYELPVGDGTGATRYVSLKKEATLGGYFDDIFVRCLQLTQMQGSPLALLAHGIQVVWVFASKAYRDVSERLSGVDSDLAELKKRLDGLEQENRELRDKLDAIG